jgi:hypothetical protein
MLRGADRLGHGQDKNGRQSPGGQETPELAKFSLDTGSDRWLLRRCTSRECRMPRGCGSCAQKSGEPRRTRTFNQLMKSRFQSVRRRPPVEVLDQMASVVAPA